MENIDGYLAISQSCSEILSTIRYYPYPAIVYKIAFNKLLNPSNEPSAPEKKNDNPPVAPVTPQPEQPSPMPISTPTPQPEQTTPKVAPIPTPTTQTTGTTDLTQLKDKLLNAIDKASLKSNLTDNITLESLE